MYRAAWALMAEAASISPLLLVAVPGVPSGMAIGVPFGCSTSSLPLRLDGAVVSEAEISGVFIGGWCPWRIDRRIGGSSNAPKFSYDTWISSNDQSMANDLPGLPMPGERFVIHMWVALPLGVLRQLFTSTDCDLKAGVHVPLLFLLSILVIVWRFLQRPRIFFVSQSVKGRVTK